MENAASWNYKEECSALLSGPHKRSFTMCVPISVRPVIRLFRPKGQNKIFKPQNYASFRSRSYASFVKSTNVAQKPAASSLMLQHKQADTTVTRPDTIRTLLQDRQCTYKRNTAACWRNNCCCGKAISITYSERVFVALVIQQAKRMCHIIS
jgi:hypothetical protein